MISKILLPIDGSDTSLKAAEYAAWFATSLDALKGTPDKARRTADHLVSADQKEAKISIILLHVINEKIFKSISSPVEGGVGHPLESIEDFLEKDATSFLDKVEVSLNDRGIDTVRKIRRGDPADEIANEAEESKADLIIIGSHGRTSAGAVLLGSVAYNVIHNEKKIPILVIRK